ncbi:kinase-like protein [Gyrodon lividus]|nr:kinase-like protein [Gyrodon lividus]
MSHAAQSQVQASSGIAYLHSQEVVHGDLSGSNVLIHSDGRACLSDFGLSTIHREISDTSQTLSLFPFPGNIRWAAPELFLEQGENRPISCLSSEQTDIYSFGSIMFQILSGKIPFHDIRRIAQIVILISRGQRPPREVGWDGQAIPDVLWNFIEQCWGSPSERPTSKEVVGFIVPQLAV